VRAAARHLVERDAELTCEPAGRRRGEWYAGARHRGPGPRIGAPRARHRRRRRRRRGLRGGAAVGGRAVGLDDGQHGAHVERVARLAAQARDDAVGRARDDHGGLVGLDLDEVLVLADAIALGHLPGDDLRRRDALADVGQAELERHQASMAARMASRTRSTEGT
jgi:hypothetical protein